MEIGDSQNGNGRGKGKNDTYQQWTMDDSNLLLGLLAEAMKNGLRDANGSLSKLNVENFILPRLNAKTRFPKTYNNYLSRIKWFKNQYNKINELMRNNSGFGWDPIGKKVTASDEVWEEYLKSHSSHKKLRTECSVDYNDLQLVVGVGTVTGNDSMALGADDTDASILGNEENTISGMEKFPYDATSNTFIAPQNNIFDESFQPQSPLQPSSQFEAPLGSMFNKEKTGQRKRSRSEYEGSSSSNGTNNHARVLDNLSVGIDSISTNFERIYNLMEKRERDREIEKRTTIWDAIKDIPDLDDTTRFRAVELLNTKTKKDMFFKMTPEERSAWILFNLKLAA
ncbi:hypothetical protein Dsin_012373 [Dipteronia sinensis]|uniref:Myb/SANT-like domain-containing protein n=1 Tax=Dipteronia sinensis TaxID=43782 RepID=A0AAE0AIF5_9ROSI|nr:hypothetical protein Dsin_012373 [Dipteronia sinensis]